MSVCAYVYVRVHLCLCMFVFVRVRVCVRIGGCTYEGVRMCICENVHVCMSTHMY